MSLPDLASLTDADLVDLQAACARELERRADLANIAATVERGLADYRQAAGIIDGGEYTPPTSYLDAYPLGWVVTYDGREWRSLRDGATGIPGESPDWREIAPEGVILPWVQPHAGGEYPVGAVVSHQGRLWRSDYEGLNGWEPGQPHSGWTDIGPAEDADPAPDAD